MPEFLTLQLNLAQISELILIAVDFVALLYVMRIPFKKRIHFVFIVFLVLGIAYPAAGLWVEFAGDSATYLSRVWWVFIFNPVAPDVVLTTFVLLYLYPKPTNVQKVKLIIPYAWLSLYWSVVIFIPSALFHGPARTTPTGWLFAPGWFRSYFIFFGFPLGFGATFSDILGLFVFVEIFLRYRTQKSPFARHQMNWLLLGVPLYIWIVSLQSGISLYTGVNIGIPVTILGTLVLLMSLRTHGWYRVTPVEVSSPMSLKDTLEQGRAYLGLSRNVSFGVFSDLVKRGMSGLCLTVVPPNEIRSKYDLKTTPIKWLVESEANEAIYPSDLQGIWISLADFIRRVERPVVILDGLEYLVSVNGFKATIEVINKLSKINSQKGGILIVSSMTEAAEPSSPQAGRLELLEELPMVHCRLKVARMVEVGEPFQMQLDLFNVGKKPAFVDHIEGVLSDQLKVMSNSSGYRLEGSTLVPERKRIEPLQLESLTLACQAREPGEITLSPKIVYRDGTHTQSSHHAEPSIIKISPSQTFEFEAEEAKSVFSYLVQEFIHDHMMRKQSTGESGWRSLPQVSENTRTPRSTLYGEHGKYGRPIYELLSRGLIEENTFSEGKGRTGETTKFRISYETDPVRRYVNRGI